MAGVREEGQHPGELEAGQVVRDGNRGVEEVQGPPQNVPESGHSSPSRAAPDVAHRRSSDVGVSGGPNIPGDDIDVSSRSSLSHLDPDAGFAHIDGDVGGPGYNETRVDIVAVPCPGADPVATWARDPLPDGYFGVPSQQDVNNLPALKELAGDAILSPAINRHLPRAAHIWVRQGIRKSSSSARVMLYRHRALADGLDLDTLALDLLDHVQRAREGLRQSRPLFFIGHSIGGLVVKLALVKASKIEKYRGVMYNCHGVSFFSTPHRGSSYLSMNALSQSIKHLLHLERPLPKSIANTLRLGNKTLLALHDDFADMSSELRIWTFYEAIDSQLSGPGSGVVGEVRFGAPLASIKSSLLGMRHEQVFSLDSDHAHCASFGPANIRTMGVYLEELAAAVAKAEDLSNRYIHTPLRLKEQVRVEVIGFYEDPDAAMNSEIRLYFTKYRLKDFLVKGPERCLEERLSRTVAGQPQRPSSARGEDSAGRPGEKGAHGIWTNVQKIWKNASAITSNGPAEQHDSPDIVVTIPSARPSMAGASNSMPAAVMRPRAQTLTVPSLSAPGFHRPSSRPSSRGSDGASSTASDPAGNDMSPKTAHPAEIVTIPAGRDGSAASAGDAAAAPAARSRVERLSKGSVLQDLTAGFSRPVPSLRKFMWIHLPFTNPLWVKDIFETLERSHSQNFGKLFNNENWVSKHVQGRHSQCQPSFVRPACNIIPADPAPPSPRLSPSPSSSGRGTPTQGITPKFITYLYLPYLHFDTYVNIIRRRNIISRRMDHGRARPVPADIADLQSLELRVVWEYLGFDPPLNCRRTLDQFGYPSLRDTYARDDDQMLYKLTKQEPPLQSSGNGGEVNTGMGSRNMSMALQDAYRGVRHRKRQAEVAETDSEPESDVEGEVKDGNILMVDQLWLWAIDKTTLATFFPKRESRPKEGTMFQQADLRNSVYNELNGDLTGRCENALDLAAFITLHAVTVLLDRSSHPDLEVFRIFEEAIGMLTERMTSSLKRFRMQSFKEIVVGEADSDPEENRTESIKNRYRRELEAAERQNRENTSALLELRDLEDELTTLLRLFDTQEATIKTMRSIYSSPELNDVTQNGRAYLGEALGRLDEYKQQTHEMLKRVDTTRKDYEKLLEMAQRQAQVDDVRWSRIQTELASTQNLSVMIFTTFTVIFLPLTFFTGIFGMNTAEWSDTPDYLSLSTIGAIALPASAALVAASLVAAFSSRAQAVFRVVFRHSSAALEGVRAGLRRLQPEAARLAKERRREAKQRAEYRSRRRKDRSYDFWAAVRRQRGSAYQIPDMNRRNPPAADGGGNG